MLYVLELYPTGPVFTRVSDYKSNHGITTYYLYGDMVVDVWKEIANLEFDHRFSSDFLQGVKGKGVLDKAGILSACESFSEGDSIEFNNVYIDEIIVHVMDNKIICVTGVNDCMYNDAQMINSFGAVMHNVHSQIIFIDNELSANGQHL